MLRPENPAAYPSDQKGHLALTLKEGARVWMDSVPLDVLLVHPDGRCVVEIAARDDCQRLLDDQTAWIAPPGVALYVAPAAYLPTDEAVTRIVFHARTPDNDGVEIHRDENLASKPTPPGDRAILLKRATVDELRGD